jgi:class 3 adenylate cyclase
MADRAVGEERKVVTILFADVIGSTALGEQLDPERLQAPGRLLQRHVVDHHVLGRDG